MYVIGIHQHFGPPTAQPHPINAEPNNFAWVMVPEFKLVSFELNLFFQFYSAHGYKIELCKQNSGFQTLQSVCYILTIVSIEKEQR